MYSIWPTLKQYKSWSVPSKLTFISAYLGFFSLVLTLFNYSIEDSNDNFEVKIINKRIESNKLIYNEEYKESTKSKVLVNYPYIEYKNNSYLEKKSNDAFKDIFNNFLEDNILDEQYHDAYSVVEVNYEQVYRIKSLIGFKFTTYTIAFGAATGRPSVITANINLNNGSYFELKDVFTNKGITKIKEMLITKSTAYDYDLPTYDSNNEVYRKRKIECQSGELMKEKLIYELADEFNNQFYFIDDNVFIIFDKYAIASGVCGPVEFSIDINKITHLINPNGPLSFRL